MIRRIVRLAVWLAGGVALIGGLYWGFLNTPEANVLTLTLSLILIVLMIAVAAIVVNVAVLVALGSAIRPSVAVGVRRSPAFVIACVPVLALVWLINRGDAWVAARSGEISAWVIATVGWADITPLFQTQIYLSAWLRWVLLPVTALAALAVWLQHGRRAIVTPRWLRAAWHWRTLLISTFAFVVLIALPWRAAYWPQEHIPATWLQPALAGLRLFLVSAVVALGAAVIVAAATARTK